MRRTGPRVCSSTTTTRAASASASRCSACTSPCSKATRRLIAECSCESGCPGCVGPFGNTGPLAKTAALRILDLLLEKISTPRTAGSNRMSLSDRLRGILETPRAAAERSSLAGRRLPKRPDVLRQETLEQTLGGEWRQQGRARCFVVERRTPPDCDARRSAGRCNGRARRTRRDPCPTLDGGCASATALPVLRCRDHWPERRCRHVCLPRRLRLVLRRWSLPDSAVRAGQSP